MYVVFSADADMDYAVHQLYRHVAYVKHHPQAQAVDIKTARKDTRRNLKHTWVRITDEHSIYCGDLAWVERMDMHAMTMTVVVVPRMEEVGEEGIRPRRGLFFARDMGSSGKGICVGPFDTFKFEGQRFRGGLLVLEGVSCYIISEEYVEPRRHEVELFQESTVWWKEDPDMFPMPHLWERIHWGETVRMIGGEWKYMGGVITWLSYLGDPDVQLSDPDSYMPKTPITLKAQHVVPDFQIGDHVEVLTGRYARRTGYVASIDWIQKTVQVKHRRTPLLFLSSDTKDVESLLYEAKGDEDTVSAIVFLSGSRTDRNTVQSPPPSS